MVRKEYALFVKGVVDRISLLPCCKRVFDKSRLGFNNTSDECKKFYKDTNPAKERIFVNPQAEECIWFFDNMVQLNPFSF